MSPLKAAAPDFTLNVAVTVAPGATGSAIDFFPSPPPATVAVQPEGTAMLSSTPVTGALSVLVKVTATSREAPGENVSTPGAAAVANAGATLNLATPYLAATTLA